MEETRPQRRLAAIISADVVGYSRLMAADEAATVRKLRSSRERVGAMVGAHGGRLVDFTGDNFLGEFPSAVDAVECAIELQKDLGAGNAALPTDEQMHFRIGIHIGDIRDEEGRLYGEGINIAARLESLAEPGGLCVSAAVRDQVQNHVSYAMRDMGTHTLKNIATPVQAFGVEVNSDGRAGSNTPAAEDSRAVAVLPFVNMSGDTEQEYFADGITEDLIADLSKVPGLPVIARTSAFVYKGQTAKVQDVARDLNVAFVVEGSVRKAGQRVRISAQLVDASTGHHVWSERFDRELDDIFAVQDAVARDIVQSLQLALRPGEFESARPATTNVEAHDAYLRGQAYFYGQTRDSLANAEAQFERAIALDPEFGLAYSSLAYTLLIGRMRADTMLPPAERKAVLARMMELARKGVAVSENEPYPHAALCLFMHISGYDLAEAVAEGRCAVELGPNDAFAYAQCGFALAIADETLEGIALMERAIRLDPHSCHPYNNLGAVYMKLQRWDDALQSYRQALRNTPGFMPSRAGLVAALVQSGDMETARAEADELLAISPAFKVNLFLEHLRGPVRELITAEWLIAAGLPAGDADELNES